MHNKAARVYSCSRRVLALKSRFCPENTFATLSSNPALRDLVVLPCRRIMLHPRNAKRANPCSANRCKTAFRARAGQDATGGGRAGNPGQHSSWLIISDAPRRRHRSQVDPGLIGGAIHEPDNALTSGVVLPKNVRFPVPVEICADRRSSR